MQRIHVIANILEVAKYSGDLQQLQGKMTWCESIDKSNSTDWQYVHHI